MIPQIKLGRWIGAGLAAAILMLAVPGVDRVTAAEGCAVAGQPANDNYICSLPFNSPGTRLQRTRTLKDRRSTATATVQGDIFDPPASGGPAETTTCDGVSYGRTVWYAFYPDARGHVSISTSASYETVITLYQFSRQTLLPDSAQRLCAVSSSGSAELYAPVEKGLAYAVQVGGEAGAGGSLSMLLDYFVRPPRRLTAQSMLRTRRSRSGVRLLGLRVSAVRGARIAVSCSRFCRPETKLVSKPSPRGEDFPRLRGISMPAGSELVIRVTAPRSIGVLIQYTVLRGTVTKETRCLEPAAQMPILRCQ